jgi:hypothetical protein
VPSLDGPVAAEIAVTESDHGPRPLKPRHQGQPGGLESPHLRQIDVARRWCISPRTLERWRCLNQGPRYLKLGGRVAYRLEDVEAYEAAQLRGSIPS